MVRKISSKIEIEKDTHEFFVQVNTGNEAQKSGLDLSEVKTDPPAGESGFSTMPILAN